MFYNKFVFSQYFEVSLLVGSQANYAGDGPSRQDRSRRLNGISAIRSNFNYYVATIDENILSAKFPGNDIRIGDEIIKINDMYCESFRNIQSYIENNSVRNITLRNIIYGEYLVVEQHQLRNEHELIADTEFIPHEITSNEEFENVNVTATVSTKRKRKRKENITNSTCFLL